MLEHHDTIVIGAGQAGLAVSRELQACGRDHVVLERGRIGETWRTQRWESFRLNTPNWMNRLPGDPSPVAEPGGFGTAHDLVRSFERYAEDHRLPVRSGVTVTDVRRAGDGRYVVTADDDPLAARHVVVASGGLNVPCVPAIAQRLSAEVVQLHAARYRSPERLPDGAVLVVGSGQSGSQIAEELIESGRHVFLSTSRVARLPRRYRGRDIMEWWRDMGTLEVRAEELDPPSLARAAQPHVSGAHGGHTLSLQQLARDGAVLLGRVAGVDWDRVRLAGDLVDNLRFADEAAARYRADVDAYRGRREITAPAPAPDPAEEPLRRLPRSADVRELCLRDAGIASVIWCTGFRGNARWLRPVPRDRHGTVVHRRGVTPSPGLFVAGLPWLTRRKSGIVHGVGDDAVRIVGAIERLDRRPARRRSAVAPVSEGVRRAA